MSTLIIDWYCVAREKVGLTYKNGVLVGNVSATLDVLEKHKAIVFVDIREHSFPRGLLFYKSRLR
jgi:hypothetical protein